FLGMTSRTYLALSHSPFSTSCVAYLRDLYRLLCWRTSSATRPRRGLGPVAQLRACLAPTWSYTRRGELPSSQCILDARLYRLLSCWDFGSSSSFFPA